MNIYFLLFTWEKNIHLLLYFLQFGLLGLHLLHLQSVYILVLLMILLPLEIAWINQISVTIIIRFSKPGNGSSYFIRLVLPLNYLQLLFFGLLLLMKCMQCLKIKNWLKRFHWPWTIRSLLLVWLSIIFLMLFLLLKGTF